MDGVESTTAIRALIGDVSSVRYLVVLLMSSKRLVNVCSGAGVDYIIAKPIDERELDDALFRYSNKLYQFHEEEADNKTKQASITTTTMIKLFMKEKVME